MFKSIDEKPEQFSHLSDGCIWLELIYNGAQYGYMGIEIEGFIASFHLEILNWSHNIYKELKSDWKVIKEFCKVNGVKKLVASNKDIHDKKWIKFIRMFGFYKTEEMIISIQEL